MIRRFYADNFRCLVNFEFRPERVNLILGRNGSGKSTLFDALRAVVQHLTGTSPQTTFPVESLPWWEVRRQQTFELDLTDEKNPDGDFSYRLVVKHSEKDAPTIVEERLKQGGKSVLEFANGTLVLPGLNKGIPFDGKQSALSLGLGQQGGVQLFLSQVIQLLVFRLNPWAMESSAREEERMLWVSGNNLVAFLRSWSQSDPEAYLGWKKRVLSGMPYLEDIQLRELLPGSRILAGMRHVGGRETLLSLANFSEGERTLIALQAIAGLTGERRVIALDEPDNFLAPSEVQPVLRLFTLTPPSGSTSQLFVVTHHPSSIDYLPSYATWLFEREEDGFSRIRKLSFDQSDGERPTDSLLAELSV